MKRRLLSLILALLLLLALTKTTWDEPLGAIAWAVTQDEIDDLKNDAKGLKTEMKEIEATLDSLRSDKADMLKQIRLLDQQINLMRQQIDNLEAQIAGYEALLVQTAYELEENKKAEKEQYALFCERARVMEEAGTTSYWSVLFKAESFSDLLSRLSDVEEVINYDQNVLDTLRQLRAQIEEKQAYQEQLKAESESAKADLETQKAETETKRSQKEKKLKEIEANEAEYQKLQDEKEKEDARIQQEIKKKTEELERQNMMQEATVGGYIWPVPSRRITSPMGSRNTGIKGASTNHKGVDIGGVGYNTTVVATKAGIVITSAYSSSYGNYVVISHGRGNTTLYAHMSSRSVKEGDTVTQGQALGVTGCTGISNGPHLHYEITEGGARVNPLNYLPGYVKAW